MRCKCEYIVWNVLPAIRKELAKILIEKYNLRQSEVAKILGVRRSAISMYLKNYRGKSFNIEKNRELIEKVAEKIVKENVVTDELMCYICKNIVK